MTDDLASSGSASPDTSTGGETASTPETKVAPNTEGQSAEKQAPADGQPAAAKSGDEGEKAEPRKTRAEQRIENLSSQLKEAQRQAQHYKGMYEKAQPAKPLDPMDFPDDASYQRALIKQTVAETQTGFAEQQAQTAEQQAAQVAQQIWETRYEDFKTTVPDFEDVAFSDKVTYSPVMLNMVRGVDNGPAIAYHLGQNPAEAQRISRLSPVETVLEIGRLSERLSKPATRRISSAPPPPTTLTGGQAPASKSPQDMSMEEYDAMVKARSKK